MENNTKVSDPLTLTPTTTTTEPTKRGPGRPRGGPPPEPPAAPGDKPPKKPYPKGAIAWSAATHPATAYYARWLKKNASVLAEAGMEPLDDEVLDSFILPAAARLETHFRWEGVLPDAITVLLPAGMVGFARYRITRGGKPRIEIVRGGSSPAAVPPGAKVVTMTPDEARERGILTDDQVTDLKARAEADKTTTTADGNGKRKK